MAGRSRSGSAEKCRTTLTLPRESLATAARIARARKVNLSTVVSEALEEGLRAKRAAERSQEVLKAYRQAFNSLTAEDVLALDGVILEPSEE